MKKILAIILTLSIFLAAIPLSAVNVFAASTGDLIFSSYSDRASYSVSGCKESASGSLSIPSTCSGKPVTSIRNYAFYNCRFLTSVNIPDSVTSIGDNAFDYCTSLKTVYYRGSQTDKNNITIGLYDEYFENATWYYNSCIGRSEHTYNSDCDAFCNVCAYKREVIHTFGDDGLCTKCGKPPYTVGDLNGDYNVDTTDLASLKLFLAAISDLSDTGKLGADINEDGKVDTTDLATLKLKLAGIE